MEDAPSKPPKKYWGFYCVKCQHPRIITDYQEGTAWTGGPFTLRCRKCDFEAVYPLSEIQILEAPGTSARSDLQE